MRDIQETSCEEKKGAHNQSRSLLSVFGSGHLCKSCQRIRRCGVDGCQSSNHSPYLAWLASVSIKGAPVRFKLDRAKANELPLSVYSSLNVSKSLKTTNVILTSYGNFKGKPKGRVQLRCCINGRSEMSPFLVVRSSQPQYSN